MRFLAAFLLVVQTAFGGTDAVVRCTNGTGMYSGSVISRNLVLTAKHCTAGMEGTPVEVRFPGGRVVTGKFVDQVKHSEGPALLRIPEGDYHTLKIAKAMPRGRNVSVTFYGYPQGTFQLSKRSGRIYPASGRLGLSGQFGHFNGDTYVNEVSVPAVGGYSGGPVLYRGQIVGIVSSTDARTSLHITHADVVRFVAKYGIQTAIAEDASEPDEPTQVAGVGIGAGIGVDCGPHRMGIGAGVGAWGPPPHRHAEKPPEEPKPWLEKKSKKPWCLKFTGKDCPPCAQSAIDLAPNTSAGKIWRERYDVHVLDIAKYPKLWEEAKKHYDKAGDVVPFFCDSLGYWYSGWNGNTEQFLKNFPGADAKDKNCPPPEKESLTPTPDPEFSEKADDRLRVACPPPAVPTAPTSPGPIYVPPPPKQPQPTPIPQVIAGKDGRPGRDGKDGKDGGQGPPGRDGKDADPAEIQSLRVELSRLALQIQSISESQSQSSEASIHALRAEMQRAIAELATLKAQPGPQGPAGRDGKDCDSEKVCNIQQSINQLTVEIESLKVMQARPQYPPFDYDKLADIVASKQKPSGTANSGTPSGKIYYDIVPQK